MIPRVCLQFEIAVFPDHTYYFVPHLAKLSGSTHEVNALFGPKHATPSTSYSVNRWLRPDKLSSFSDEMACCALSG